MRNLVLWLFWMMAVTGFMKLVCVAFGKYPMKVEKWMHFSDLLLGVFFIAWAARVLWP